MVVLIASWLIGIALVCLLPAWMLAVEYNLAVAVAYFWLSATVLAMHGALVDLKKSVEAIREHQTRR